MGSKALTPLTALGVATAATPLAVAGGAIGAGNGYIDMRQQGDIKAPITGGLGGALLGATVGGLGYAGYKQLKFSQFTNNLTPLQKQLARGLV